MATHKLTQYIAEARIDPYILEVDDDRANDITIQCPTGETVIEIAETPINESRKILRLLCGDQFDAVWGIVGPLEHTVLQAFVMDIVDEFKINQMATAPGGSGASRR